MTSTTASDFETRTEREPLGRRLLTYATFPVVFGAAVGAGMWGVTAGIDRLVLVPSVIVTATLFIIVLERVHPHVREWNRAKGDVGTDVLHGIVSLGITPEIFRALAFGALYAAAAWLSTAVGLDFWPTSWPLFFQVVLAMLVSEFGSYWAHRLMHENATLWTLHATHHTAERLYWLNAVRFHPLDTLISFAGQSIPLVLMGCPEGVLALFTIYTAVHGAFQHANIRLKLGPLNWFFSMAELHRWHHSKLVEEGNTNYGSNVIFWDIVFGTRFLPSDRVPPEEIGVAGLERFPRGYLAQLASPFRWTQVERESGQKE